MLFRSNDTATTEIYTRMHTLSLHDALPIFPVKSTFKAINIVEIFMKESFRLHGISKMVILYRDVKFTSAFWKELFVRINTNLNFSTSYHPQTDGQTERTNQIVEEMLHIYVRTKPNKWEDYIHLVEFAYNNG